MGGSKVIQPQGGAHRERWSSFLTDSLSFEVKSEFSNTEIIHKYKGPNAILCLKEYIIYSMAALLKTWSSEQVQVWCGPPGEKK